MFESQVSVLQLKELLSFLIFPEVGVREPGCYPFRPVIVAWPGEVGLSKDSAVSGI